MMFHPEIDKLLVLRSNATPGVWGPTTAPPEGVMSHYQLAKGERGKPTWGAVVSDETRGWPIDHERYAKADYAPWFEEGTDHYGGTLVGESLQSGNGEYIAALHNKLPGLVETVRNLRSMILSTGMHPITVDQIIADSMEGNDPS